MKKRASKAFLLLALFASTTAFAGDKISVSGGALQKGQAQPLVLHLSRDGAPIVLNDLKEVHKSKIHLLIVDDGMTDYQHIHPQVSDEAGVYTFSFTPKTAHNYTVWADITPINGSHEYLGTTLQGEQPCGTSCIDKTPSLMGVAGGLKGVLTFDNLLQAGDASMGTLAITDEKGRPVTDLEPVMGAFAHIVGFYADYPGVVHLHPMGDEPKTDKDRGGPELMFHLALDHAGVIKLFAQVKHGGKDVFIPFTLGVK